MSRFLSFFLILISCSNFIPPLQAACNAGDEKALLAFRNGDKSRVGILSDWAKPGSSCCSWSGITCKSDRVISISLPTLGLRGQIPREVGRLSQLQTLDLSRNAMEGPLPPELGKLAQLQVLNVASNFFSAPIPEALGLLSNLRYLYAFGNRLSGRIPYAFVRGLSNLMLLHLSDNFITRVPGNMGSLKHLETFHLGNNTLAGFEAISGLATLPHLSSLGLRRCGLKGPIPVWMRNMKLKTGKESVMRIDLAENEITGEIPQEFGELAELVTLDLHSNKLTGRVPDSIGRLTKLIILDLSSNLLTGIPRDLRSLGVDTLYMLKLSSNNLGFDELRGLATLSRVVLLELSSCRLKGPIPDWFSSIPIVQKDGESAVLQLDSNEITGSIPATFSRFARLTHLDLHDNKMSEAIPATLSTIESLRSLDLSRNRLTGGIPAELQKLKRLEYFNVSSNQLQGKIPAGPPFDIMDSSYFEGNAGLCGAPLPACK